MDRERYSNEGQGLSLAGIESPIEIGTTATTTAITMTAVANSNEKGQVNCEGKQRD